MASISAEEFWRTYEIESDKNSGTPGVSKMAAKYEPSGMLQAILSEQNQNNSFFSSMEYKTNSRNETIVKYKTQQRYTPDDVGDTPIDDYCTSSDTTEWIPGQKALGEYTNIKFEIEYDDIKKVGNYQDGLYNDAQTFFDNKIARAANAILQKIDSALIIKFLADKGINLTTGGSTPIVATGINSTTNPSVNQSFEFAVRNEYRFQNYYNKSILVGDGIFPSYVDLLNPSPVLLAGGLLTQEGVVRTDDQARVQGGYRFFSPYYSKNIDAETGVANSVLGFEPGTFMWAGANRFTADGRHGDMITTARVLDMGQGIFLPVDITMKNVQCSRALPIVMTLEVNWDTLSFDPATSFKASDPNFGSNSMTQFTIAQV